MATLPIPFSATRQRGAGGGAPAIVLLSKSSHRMRLGLAQPRGSTLAPPLPAALGPPAFEPLLPAMPPAPAGLALAPVCPAAAELAPLLPPAAAPAPTPAPAPA